TSKAFSFPTSFAFTVVTQYPTLGGHSFAFTISIKDLQALPNQYLGLLNPVKDTTNSSQLSSTQSKISSLGH
ncbi:hypothetical protein Tsubulata_021664, partial [Turnera subulata]